MPRESKYAAKLRELGCKPFSDMLRERGLVLEVDGQRMDGSMLPLSRSERRRLIAEGKIPNFAAIPDIHSPTGKRTFLAITVETGETWEGPLGIEAALKKLKFRDNSERIKFLGPSVH